MINDPHAALRNEIREEMLQSFPEHLAELSRLYADQRSAQLNRLLRSLGKTDAEYEFFLRHDYWPPQGPVQAGQKDMP